MSESEGLAWTLSTTEFYEQYEVSLIDTEELFDNTALDVLREVALSSPFNELISAITGQGGLKVADVACHRSTTGQQIGIHNDFYPGGETCRFTIHLNPAWQLDEGGLFVTFASEDSATMRAAYLPAMNSALVFEISRKSFHAVTAVTSTRPRYSIVISFLQEDLIGPLNPEATRLADIRQNKLPLLRPDVIDVQTLKHLRTRRCAPLSCGGACCRDGAGLLPEEMTLLSQVALAYTEELRELGVNEAGLQKSGASPRTSIVTDADGRTHCSWLMPDGRCSLQVLGENHVQQPWFYKPLACILLPLRVRSQLGARVLTADHRAFDRSTVMDPCLRYDPTAPVLESVDDEIAFIAEVWDIDVGRLVDVADHASFSPRAASNRIGVVAATQTHLLSALRAYDGESVEVVKVRRTDSDRSPPSQEEAILRKLVGRWFPIPSESSDRDGATRMSFVVGHLPLNVWLNTQPREDDVIDVARDLLRALVALEDQEIYHLDLAPRNVLVDPTQRAVMIVDFEDAIDSVSQVECVGGSFGYAAPEQYLNYLGLHSRVTESFFVGAVLY
ncbi:MAG: 2OG-Fe(II) oxygenase, partial [Acidobacteriota bacterium]|nr:2OG-Fe(II) oxygenase [Acidobacteriota bacterium]